MYKTSLLAAATAALVTFGTAISAAGKAEMFDVDPSHSQIVFSYEHLGYSKTFGMLSGFNGEIAFNAEDPAASAVSVSMPVLAMFTGWEDRTKHFMSEDFFGASEGDLITFASTGIEVTGEKTAKITGDLTMNGTTKAITLDAELKQASPYPFGPKEGTPTMGFYATTTVLRSDYGLGAFAPAVSDEVEIMISLEAAKAK
ncbi:YceI family protein [uncultured Tateyamaria sp.]|uniref:YceI family protein n=1 Tax=uncultured Tateyamaria sp. TaxID=455651 RepID=UPI00260FE255|nr:YceI family protein [uncultured Tateyamaria sp.]